MSLSNNLNKKNSLNTKFNLVHINIYVWIYLIYVEFLFCTELCHLYHSPFQFIACLLTTDLKKYQYCSLNISQYTNENTFCKQRYGVKLAASLLQLRFTEFTPRAAEKIWFNTRTWFSQQVISVRKDSFSVIFHSMVDGNPALRVIKTLCKHTQMNQSPETDSRNPRYNQCLWGPSVIGEISLSFPVRSLETMPFHRERRAEWPWICLIHFNRIPSIRKKEKKKETLITHLL